MSLHVRNALFVLASLGLAAGAHAQVTETTMFTGSTAEEFNGAGDGYASGQNIATSFGHVSSPTNSLRGLCALVAGDGCYVMGRSSGGFLAKLSPECWPGGNYAMSFTLDEPAKAFGAFFAQDLPGTANTYVRVYDQTGDLVHSSQPTIPTGCGWYWLGWRGQGDSRISRVDVIHTGYSSLAIDDIQVDHSGPGSTYCHPYVPNSLGTLGELSLEGSTTLGSGELTFRVNGVPERETGVLMVGRAPTMGDSPLGSQGTLCVGGECTFVPLASFVTEADGSRCITLEESGLPTLPSVETFVPGESVYFQVWYRDHNPAATSNTTNAVWVTFQ